MLDSEDGRRGRAEHALPAAGPIILIDSRRLERECFVRSIELLHPELTVLGYGTADELADAHADLHPASIILFNLGGRLPSEPSVRTEMETLNRCHGGAPIVVLARSEGLDQMIAAHDAGAIGYIPSSLGVDAIIESARLAALGGVVLRFASLSELRKTCAGIAAIPADSDHFTDRQAAVAEAMRQGKPNKVIAHELNMCESTVKVHIRKIMGKLNSSNRTEAAFKLNQLLSPPAG